MQKGLAFLRIKSTQRKTVVDRRSWHDSLTGEEVGRGNFNKVWMLQKKKKMSVVIHVRSSLSGRKETDGTGRSMTEGQREKSFMYTAAFVFPGLEKIYIDRDIDDRGKKSYVEHQMTEEGQAHT